MNRKEPADASPPAAGDDAEWIASCAERAIALMHTNLGPQGFFAATPGADARARGYDRVFGRDAAICAIAVAHCGDDALIAGAERSLLTLGAHQAANGQIPKYVDTANNSADFWYLGCLDATLWWLIAIAHLAPPPGVAICRSANLSAAALAAGRLPPWSVAWLLDATRPGHVHRRG